MTFKPSLPLLAAAVAFSLSACTEQEVTEYCAAHPTDARCSNVQPTPEPEPTPPAKPSAAEKLADLENRGAIPKLDRSDSLEGSDQDNNGIRDDVDAYIAQHYPAPPQRKAAEQFARAMQEAVTTGSTSVDTARAIDRRSSAAISCIFDRFDGENGSAYPAAVVEKLEGVTANTKKRLKSYLAYNKTLNGTALSSSEGDNCEE